MIAPITLGCIIPSYARPAAVRRAAGSALLFGGFSEVIVVDDASAEPVNLTGIADPRLRVLRHEINRGVCAARNTGTAAARASHLLYLDDDDVLLPWAGWFYRRWIAAAVKMDRDAIVVGGVIVDGEGRTPHLRRPPSSQLGEIWGLDRHLAHGKRSVNTKQAAVIRRALIERVCGWDEALRSRSSSEMFYRLTEVAPVVGHPLPVYRLNRGDHAKLTADPTRRIESHAYIRRKHVRLLADPQRQSAFEAVHEAMMNKTAGTAPRREAAG